MLAIRWFGAFRRVDDLRSSVIYELSDPGKERAAEVAVPDIESEAVTPGQISDRIRDLRAQGYDPWVRTWVEDRYGNTRILNRITYRINCGMFSVWKRVGFLYRNNSIRRIYDTDVWSYESSDGSGRLKALRPDNESDHSEAWVVGAPVGVVIRVACCPRDKWWRQVEKTARAFAKMRGIAVYELVETTHGQKLRRVN